MSKNPTYEIDWKIFELALQAGFPQNKIAAAFQIDPDTLNKYTKKRYNGKGYRQLADSFCCKGEMYLTIAQYQKALDDKLKYNTSMLMYLGRVRLGQKDADSAGDMPKNDEVNQLKAIINARDYEILKLKKDKHHDTDKEKPEADREF